MKKINFFLCFMFCLFLLACSKKQSEISSTDIAESNNSQISENEKMGTKWGDEINSRVKEVDIKRISNLPIAETQIRYADKKFSGKEINNISIGAGKLNLSIIDDDDHILPIFRDGQNYYLEAKEGQSYQLKYENNTDKTFEIVTSVDGLDVINGSAASRQNSGYVLSPHDTLIIQGFRKSDEAVASFTFGKPQDAYAANTSSGSIDNTGIIGTVVYELIAQNEVDQVKDATTYAPAPNAFPADK
nr:hypothetical protein [Acinetobacter sp. Marseille-Q1620]